jgi:addiction module HigA family antidote
MQMYNPPHPGKFIYSTYMEPFDISCRQLAKHLQVAASTLNRILKTQSGISPEMALRLSAVLGRTPESWLSMQDSYDLWQAKQNIKLNVLTKIELEVA